MHRKKLGRPQGGTTWWHEKRWYLDPHPVKAIYESRGAKAVTKPLNSAGLLIQGSSVQHH